MKNRIKFKKKLINGYMPGLLFKIRSNAAMRESVALISCFRLQLCRTSGLIYKSNALFKHLFTRVNLTEHFACSNTFTSGCNCVKPQFSTVGHCSALLDNRRQLAHSRFGGSGWASFDTKAKIRKITFKPLFVSLVFTLI